MSSNNESVYVRTKVPIAVKTHLKILQMQESAKGKKPFRLHDAIISIVEEALDSDDCMSRVKAEAKHDNVIAEPLKIPMAANLKIKKIQDHVLAERKQDVIIQLLQMNYLNYYPK